MTALNEDLLSQHFDGELADEDAEVLRRELERDGELHAKLEGLEHLSSLIGEAATTRGDEVDSDALFASITAELDDDVVDDEPMYPVAVPDEPRRPKLAVVAGGQKASEVETRRGTGRSEPRRRAGLWIGVGATVAAAAALLLWVMQPGDGAQPTTLDDGSGSTIAEVAPPHGSEIEEVDFGYNTGAIFSVEGSEGEQYAVVWISDEKPILDEEAEERVQ